MTGGTQIIRASDAPVMTAKAMPRASTLPGLPDRRDHPPPRRARARKVSGAETTSGLF
jgi:hypothetical protein